MGPRTTVMCAFVMLSLLVTNAQGSTGDGDNPNGLLDPVWYTVKGQPVGNKGCAYTLSSELRPGQDAIQQDVLKVDEGTCTVYVVEGVPPDPGTYADPKGGSSDSSEATAQASAPLSPDQSPAPSTRALRVLSYRMYRRPLRATARRGLTTRSALM